MISAGGLHRFSRFFEILDGTRRDIRQSTVGQFQHEHVVEPLVARPDAALGEHAWIVVFDSGQAENPAIPINGGCLGKQVTVQIVAFVERDRQPPVHPWSSARFRTLIRDTLNTGSLGRRLSLAVQCLTSRGSRHQ